jgi:hypothetical protein
MNDPSAIGGARDALRGMAGLRSATGEAARAA